MSKPTYTPGAGFPNRLRSLLYQKNLRPAALEAESVLSADALARWLNGECYPEKQTYFNLCRRLALNSAEGWNLLRSPGEAPLVCAGKTERQLARFLQSCTQLESLIPALDGEQAQQLAVRLRALTRSSEERRKAWQTSTTTPSEDG